MASQDAPDGERIERSTGALRALPPEELPPHRHSFPAPRTSFVGRAMELDELAALLAAPACRLLTIIGPGGIGKTRLAIEAAPAARASFPNGIAFVSLRAVNSTEAFAPVLADAIGCVLRGQENTRAQVARYLRPLQILLVLDNFEHLLGAAPWLSDLLAAAPGLRLLVTSREALNLEEEWRYPLAGLAVPTADSDDPSHVEAVRLFVERALQVRPDFALDAELDGVVRLCQITEGLPLALELAAAWVKALPCQAIADEIERNAAFLSTELRNVPARHRSMLAAFDHSWARLDENERRVFQRLAVFRGGFRREAAEVAGAPMPLLSSLVDKSLVRRGVDGRLFLHELLRQYAEDHLRADPDEAAQAHASHRAYYLDIVAECFGSITGGDQRRAIATIAADLDNIRAAWHGAVAAGDVEALGRASHVLTQFFDFRARYREGLALLEEGLAVARAADASPAVDRVLAHMLVDVARCHHRLLQLPAMRAALDEAEERYARLGIPPPSGHMTDPQVWRGILALIDGHYAEAERLCAEVVRRSAETRQYGSLSPAWWVRASAALWQEQLDLASEYARQSTAATQAAGDRWHLAYCLNLQGHIATARAAYVEARQCYEAAYVIREEFEDPEGMAGALSHLARMDAQLGHWDEAARLYARSFDLARDIGDLAMQARLLDGLSRVACETGAYDAAGRYIVDGLRLASESGYMRRLVGLLASAANLLLQTGRALEAVAPLVVAGSHQASDHETRAWARQLLDAAAAALPAEAFAEAVERGQDGDPLDLAARLDPLLTSRAPLAHELVPAQATRSPVAQALIEPLTERELAVLRLIAAGHSNRQIAEELFLAVNTVRSYCQQLYGKLAVSSRTQAVARARDLGLIP